MDGDADIGDVHQCFGELDDDIIQTRKHVLRFVILRGFDVGLIFGELVIEHFEHLVERGRDQGQIGLLRKEQMKSLWNSRRR